MVEDHPSETTLLAYSKFDLRIPETAILKRHLRFCRYCNRRYRILTLASPDAQRPPDLEDQDCAAAEARAA